jgi:ubiquinone/menaquinone biosynthesis C-methylase UbiE
MNDLKQKVKDAYDCQSKDFLEKGSQFEWNYLASKMMTDHYLLSKIDLEDKILLNIGCAPEPIDEMLYAKKAKQWIATDINENVVKTARAICKDELSAKLLNKISFETADATKLPYADESFDVVTAMSTIEHIPEKGYRQALTEISRVLKKGGMAVITLTNILNLPYYFYSKRLQRDPNCYFGYEAFITPFEFKRYLLANNLSPLEFASDYIYTPSGILKYLLMLPLMKYYGARMGYLVQKTG